MKKPTPEKLERAVEELREADRKHRSSIARLAIARKRDVGVEEALQTWQSTNLSRLWRGYELAQLFLRVVPEDPRKAVVLVARYTKPGGAA